MRKVDSDHIYIFKLAKYGKYLHDHDVEEKIIDELVNISKKLPVNGILVLDFKDVKLLSPVSLLNIANRFENTSKKHGQGLFRGRYILVKDPNEDIRMVLLFVLKEKKASLMCIYSDLKKNKILKDEILNLPKFLQETIDIIKKHGPLSSNELSKILGQEAGASTRERLRLLYKKGLIERAAQGSLKGDRYFLYKVLDPAGVI